MGKNYASPVAICGKCGAKDSGQWIRRVVSSGDERLSRMCAACGDHVESGREWYPKDMLSSDHFDSLPLEIDDGYFSCEVEGCMNPRSERHHSAPRELWGDDCEMWPKLQLCRFHHSLWHDVISGRKIYTGDSEIDDYRERVAHWRKEGFYPNVAHDLAIMDREARFGIEQEIPF